MPSLPIVDIAAFRRDPAGREGRRFVDELREHLHTTGFVYVRGHGVDPDLDRRLLEQGRAFFALPEQERKDLAIANSAAFRGYTILGDERTQGKADWRDQLDYGPEQAAPEPGHDGPPWLRLRGPNQWPASLPGLAPVALEWMEALHGVGVSVVEAIALGLDQPADRFSRGFVPDHDLHVKIIRYPVNPDPVVDQGVGLHHDTGVATFILQNDVAGLQVMVDDALVTAEPIPGTYVLNLGAMLQAASGGYLRATPHRVVSPTEVDRISVALFFNPTFESTFEPVELPAALAAEAHPELRDLHGAEIHTLFGENNLKVRLRSHPDVARNHYADVIGQP
ncbi:MAG: 2-oxoglutarate and iron-dependent oxygenase domain-containing protein [Actinomycetota bacterium]